MICIFSVFAVRRHANFKLKQVRPTTVNGKTTFCRQICPVLPSMLRTTSWGCRNGNTYPLNESRVPSGQGGIITLRHGKGRMALGENRFLGYLYLFTLRITSHNARAIQSFDGFRGSTIVRSTFAAAPSNRNTTNTKSEKWEFFLEL